MTVSCFILYIYHFHKHIHQWRSLTCSQTRIQSLPQSCGCCCDSSRLLGLQGLVGQEQTLAKQICRPSALYLGAGGLKTCGHCGQTCSWVLILPASLLCLSPFSPDFPGQHLLSDLQAFSCPQLGSAHPQGSTHHLLFG